MTFFYLAAAVFAQHLAEREEQCFLNDEQWVKMSVASGSIQEAAAAEEQRKRNDTKVFDPRHDKLFSFH